LDQLLMVLAANGQNTSGDYSSETWDNLID
jgi:hypothetical protein